jgi:hypothetical protein
MKNILLGALFGLLLSGTAHAGLLGDTITASYQFPTLGTIYGPVTWSPATFQVGPGQETDGLVEGVTHILVDFTDTTLQITLTTTLDQPTWNSVAFNGPVFDGLLGLAGGSVDVGATNLVGFDDSRILTSGNELALNWSGLGYTTGSTVVVDFSFAAPEPASLALFGMGLTGLAAAYRKRPTAAPPSR